MSEKDLTSNETFFQCNHCGRPRPFITRYLDENGDNICNLCYHKTNGYRLVGKSSTQEDAIKLVKKLQLKGRSRKTGWL